MTTKSKTKKNSKKVATTIKRGRGRPASFPGVECKAKLTKIPVAAVEQWHALREKWGVNLDQALVRMIERSHKDAFRSRSKKN